MRPGLNIHICTLKHWENVHFTKHNNFTLYISPSTSRWCHRPRSTLIIAGPVVWEISRVSLKKLVLTLLWSVISWPRAMVCATLKFTTEQSCSPGLRTLYPLANKGMYVCMYGWMHVKAIKQAILLQFLRMPSWSTLILRLLPVLISVSPLI